MEAQQQDDGRSQAFRMVQAMEGVTDQATRKSMWRAALRYRARDRDAGQAESFARVLSW
mgnify:CR=1 FL=1